MIEAVILAYTALTILGIVIVARLTVTLHAARQRITDLETDKAETNLKFIGLDFRVRAIEAAMGYVVEPVTIDVANYRWKQ